MNRLTDKKKRLELQTKYEFPDWHLITADKKPYIDDLVKYIVNEAKKEKAYRENLVVIECGCGLCDIVGDDRLGCMERLAFDTDERVVAADREIFGDSIDIQKGSFDDISELKADFFVSVNFIHDYSLEKVSKWLTGLFERNDIGYFIVDEVTGRYPYSHCYSNIISSDYTLKESLGPYPADGGERFIKIFKKD